MMPHPPEVKSFMVADQVFQQASGTWCIIGTFDNLTPARYPAFLQSVGLYARISDAEGDYRVRIEFCNAAEEVLAVLSEMQVRAKDRLATGDFGIQSYNLLIPSPGKYFFRMHFNDMPAHASIQIDAKSPGPGS